MMDYSIGSDDNETVALLSRAIVSAFGQPAGEDLDGFKIFRRNSPPGIPLDAYLTRLTNYLHPDPRVLLGVLIYIDRLKHGHCILLDACSAHRFVLTAIVVASKALADDFYSTSFYSRVGGVSSSELCALELALCQLLDWHLHCTPEELLAIRQHISRLK